MQEHDEARTVNRRRLLRRAGTVAAGAAGVTVAGAMVSAPAQAAAGDNLVLGQVNESGTATTSLTGGDATRPTLRLENTTGPALSVNNIAVNTNSPAGSVYVDEYGDFSSITVDGGNKYLTMAYSPTWATMTIPVPARRIVHSGTTEGRQFIVPGSANFDGSGRVLPKGSSTVPDMIIDLSSFLAYGTPWTAVQGNLTCSKQLDGGYAALWASGPWPGNSSLNFPPTQPAANFTQTLVAEDLTIRLKLNVAAVVIFDLAGFVVSDSLGQFAQAGTMGMKAAKGSTGQRRRARRIS